MTEVTISLRAISMIREGKTILDRIELPLINANDGGLIGLVGPNGAGKSTLLDILAGVLQPTHGVVELGRENQAVAHGDAEARAQLISYLPQTRPVHWAMRVRDVVRLGRYAFGGHLNDDVPCTDDPVLEAIAQVGLTGFEDRPVHQLSGGECARVHLARALAARTPIMLADEPIAGLDPAFQFEVMATLKAYANPHRHVIAALHDLRLAAAFCDRIIMINDGRIVAQGKPKEVLSRQRLRDIFRIDGQWTDGDLDLRAL
ncbi:MAG: ABC transporter ATP-binding protein [Pseudomonadota bacterium]